jgi:hypothetical protein
MTPQEIIDSVGARIARDLAEQARRPAREAAVEAGCRSDADVDAWTARHRPAAAATGQRPAVPA